MPKRVPPLAASLTIYTAFHVLTTPTKLLHGDEFTHMCFCSVGIPLILGGLKIIKYVQYLVCIRRQNVLQRSHIAQVSYITFLVTDFTISLITIMVYARLEFPTRSAKSHAFTIGILIRGSLLVVGETSLAPEMSISFGAGNYDGGEDA